MTDYDINEILLEGFNRADAEADSDDKKDAEDTVDDGTKPAVGGKGRPKGNKNKNEVEDNKDDEEGGDKKDKD